MSKSDLAVVTMVFNEGDILPIWLKYYGGQVGLENCYVIDHGSTDLSTHGIAPANIIRIPRSPLDEPARCKFVSEICNALLTWFGCVAYTDVDEILVADPATYPDLPSYARAAKYDVTTAFGMDLLHSEPEEGPLDPQRPILSQRHWVRPFSSLCKPTLIRRPIRWGPGFHYADTATHFDDLYLFHLAYVDFDIIRRRQRKRVATPRAGAGGEHHSIPEDDMVNHIRQDYTRLPRLELESVDLAQDSPGRLAFTQRLFERQEKLGDGLVISSGISSSTLWRVPKRFQDCF
ncbi:MAG TPA: glycosyltransferase family 2 protein [Acetobacteraceae bacterium]|nr:glycosyltransferase family 2 protein [Acetobacteraceae bacterium]